MTDHGYLRGNMNWSAGVSFELAGQKCIDIYRNACQRKEEIQLGALNHLLRFDYWQNACRDSLRYVVE